MVRNINLWRQTRHWEEACINTRRDTKERKRRVSFFKINKKARVLDLGCGDGLNIKVLKSLGIRNVTGVDISEDLLRIARRNNKGTKFFLASAEKLPFKDNSFEVVLVDSVFHHLLRYKKSLSEIKRVLFPGGNLCFIEPHKSFLRSLYDFVSELPIAKFVPKLKERSKSYLGEKRFMKHWLKSEETFYKNLDDLGFVEKLKLVDILSIVGVYQKPFR